MEKVVPKIAHERESDAGQSRKRWIRSCSWWPHALQEIFSYRFILHR